MLVNSGINGAPYWYGGMCTKVFIFVDDSSILLVEESFAWRLVNRSDFAYDNFSTAVESSRQLLTAEWTHGIQKILAKNDDTLSFFVVICHASRSCLAWLLKLFIDCCLISIEIAKASLVLLNLLERTLLRLATSTQSNKLDALTIRVGAHDNSQFNTTSSTLIGATLQAKNRGSSVEIHEKMERSTSTELSFLIDVALECPHHCGVEVGLPHNHVDLMPRSVPHVQVSPLYLTEFAGGSIDEILQKFGSGSGGTDRLEDGTSEAPELRSVTGNEVVKKRENWVNKFFRRVHKGFQKQRRGR